MKTFKGPKPQKYFDQNDRIFRTMFVDNSHPMGVNNAHSLILNKRRALVNIENEMKIYITKIKNTS